MLDIIERRPITTIVVVLCVLVAILLTFKGFDPSNDSKGLGDAPVGRTHEAPRQIWLSPDNFMNVAAYCIGVDGVYVHTRPAGPVIIANDANCLPGGILYEGPEIANPSGDGLPEG